MRGPRRRQEWKRKRETEHGQQRPGIDRHPRRKVFPARLPWHPLLLGKGSGATEGGEFPAVSSREERPCQRKGVDRQLSACLSLRLDCSLPFAE